MKLTVNNNEFPAWQDVDQEGFYLVYALNSGTGEKGFYQYDTMEESYQRFVVSENTEEKEASANTNKIFQLVEKNLMIVLIGVVALVLILLIVL